MNDKLEDKLETTGEKKEAWAWAKTKDGRARANARAAAGKVQFRAEADASAAALRHLEDSGEVGEVEAGVAEAQVHKI